MEPLNLMVSLTHFANAKPENKRGLSRPAGRPRQERPAAATTHRWWRIRLRRVARIAIR